VSVLATVSDYVDTLVHPLARGDALSAARHRAFIAPRLAGGLSALAVLPVRLALWGLPSWAEIMVFGWLVSALFAAYDLSRTGRLDRAYLMSSLALTALVTVVATTSGGLGSSAVMLLVAVPLEAALSGGRRPVLAASSMAAAAVVLLLAADAAGLVSASRAGGGDSAALTTVGVAVIYASMVALGSGLPARIGPDLLRSEEARYRLLAGNMTDVIIRHGRNGAVLFASPAAERLIGVPVSALSGHRLFDRVHVADRPAYLTALSDAAFGGQSRSVEFRILVGQNDDGAPAPPRFLWIEMRCRPLDAAEGGGAEREVVSVLRDMTTRKAQEQALEDARLDAELANATKGRFLATMSHELRTPLNAIIGFSDMLLNEQELGLEGPRRRDYARLINESGQHLLSVVNGILDMSRIETGNFEITPEPFALGPVISGCCQLLALKAHEAGIDLVHRHGTRLPEIVADKRAIKQVLLNLLSNAVKFTPRDGRVCVSATAEASSVTITVEDTGVGISDADLEHLGDPFFQVRGCYDRPRDGTGLGLSIVKGLVALHGGQLDIDSRVGEGTRVTVRLPVNCESGPAGSTRAHPDRSAAIATPAPVADMRVKKRA